MRISDQDARELGRLVYEACRRKALTDDQVAAQATAAIPESAPHDLVVTASYVQALRGVCRQPLSRPDSRVKFAAVVKALGLDREVCNKLAGGI